MKDKGKSKTQKRHIPSPTRHDTEMVMYDLTRSEGAEWNVNLETASFDWLERKTGLQLTDALRKEINTAIQVHIYFRAVQTKSFLRKEIGEKFDSLKNALMQLDAFFRAEESTPESKVEEKVVDELCLMTFEFQDISRNLERPRIPTQYPIHRIFDGEKVYPKVSTNAFHYQLSTLIEAVDRAHEKFLINVPGDKGGNSKDTTRLEWEDELENIFKKANGKGDKAFFNFLECVRTLVPEKYRPAPTRNVESHRKRTQRRRKKIHS